MQTVNFKKIYVGRDAEMPLYVFQPHMLQFWQEVLLDEPSTKSVMIFRKNKYGDISVETIMRENDHIRSHVADDTISEERMWNNVYTATSNGCLVYLTLNAKRYNRWFEEHRDE